ncbi:flavodoxin family protein [Pelotomaculum terephthalicicum JT]|uniref:flavodoxin family protein n=1 Tax=Pelotomaculum TaxID=191373 RepID=UPI001F03A139|nr:MULTISPECIES: flavodoxin family protein [Pelotomaculum]MCG9969437.1 flavodoxin family protein [Pelotomaculum terephthalicicum JT]
MMKVLLTYSSRTGNTEKVAKAIQEVVPADTAFSQISGAPPPEEFDMVVVGFWIDKGKPNQEALDYLSTLKNKKTAFFCTMGAHPDSPHGQKYIKEARTLFQENQLVGEFACQGKIDEKLIETFKAFPPGHPHALTEESMKRFEIASNHPDEADLDRARETFREIFQ